LLALLACDINREYCVVLAERILSAKTTVTKVERHPGQSKRNDAENSVKSSRFRWPSHGYAVAGGSLLMQNPKTLGVVFETCADAIRKSYVGMG